ncbi:ankyrin repeat domain-containing protein [Endozoicomonas sp. YOMI1]|uniref:ankyrin repeat domain-containing protein n=1 Tax=Endozoicomonas sp. YOMI1 TaxID=2828739 RepID=UPI002148B632|nr:ankyrin repeat domain-containing protein [Endozoicomonas sp. YOMI1]
MHAPSSSPVPDDRQTQEVLKVTGILNDSGFDLLEAASHGNLALVKALLEQGADIESRDQAGRTSLFLAVISENPEVANFLLHSGASVNACDCDHRTPLHEARSQAVVKELLGGGANIEAREVNGRTPLSLAAESENPEVFNVLLDAGASIDARDCFGETPLHRARCKEAMKALLDRGADIEARSDHEETPLFSVVSEIGSCEVVKVLLAAGASVNARNCFGRTPLHNAHSQEVVKELLARGADIEARDHIGQTPLFSANRQNSLEGVKALLAAGACVNARDNTGRTPLHNARSPEIVNELLTRGADIEARDNGKATPLICAIKNIDRLEVVKELLVAGANIEAADELQRTPLHFAASGWCHDLRYMGVLLSEGANLEARQEITRYTPLHEAALSLSGKKVQVLVAEGANYKVQDWHRDTPLDLAMDIIGNMKVLLAATGRFDSINQDNEPGNFQPQSLQACARTSIRLRLIEHRKETGEPLSKSVQALPLGPPLKVYLYKPLMEKLI